jgi:uncharacterized protein
MSKPSYHQALLISQRVQSGLESEYSAWRQEIVSAAGEFEGFLGQQVYPPVAGLQEDYIVLLHFDRSESLATWMQSDRRKALLEKGEILFAQPPTLVIMAAPPEPVKTPVAAVITSSVSPDHIEEFKAWQQSMDLAQRKFPGYLGSESFPPVAEVTRDWTVVFRFDTEEHLECWLKSDVRKQLIASSDQEFQSFDLKKLSSTYNGWFPPASEDQASPPAWAMAMVVVMALYPTVMLCGKATAPALQGVSFASNIFLNNVLGTIVLTWFSMPLANKLMKWWLYPPKEKASHLRVRGLVLILVYYAAAVAFFKWLG